MLAKYCGIGFELLVAGYADLQRAQMLGTRVGLTEDSQSEQGDQDEQSGNAEERNQQLRPDLRRNAGDCSNERVVRAPQQPPASAGSY